MKKLFLLFLLLLTSCVSENDRTPLGWCMYDIRQNEGYEECTYIVQEIEPYSLIEKEKINKKDDIKAYYITTFTDDLKTEWYCFIEYEHTLYRFIKYEKVVCIDCDILSVQEYEGE